MIAWLLFLRRRGHFFQKCWFRIKGKDPIIVKAYVDPAKLGYWRMRDEEGLLPRTTAHLSS